MNRYRNLNPAIAPCLRRRNAAFRGSAYDSGWDHEWAASLAQYGGGPLGVRGLPVCKQLDGLIPGDTRELLVYPVVPVLRAGVSRAVTVAWFSIKDDETDADATENAVWTAVGARQKITTTNNPGIGQILQAVTPELRFDLTAANTVFLTARRTYYFDVQVKMEDGAIYTVEAGAFTTGQQITIATG